MWDRLFFSFCFKTTASSTLSDKILLGFSKVFLAHKIIPTPICLLMDGEFYPFDEYPKFASGNPETNNKSTWKVGCFPFLGIFLRWYLSDTNYSMNGNSSPIVPYSYISERLDADQRLTTEAQRRAIEVLKEKRDLRSIVPWWKPSVRGDFRKSWGSMGCCCWESWSCVVFFFGVIVGFCWKWRSPSRLKIWETGDFHLTSLSSILIGRALEIIRMSVFQWAFLFFLLGLFGVLERICIIHLVVCEVRNYPFTSYLKSIESIS